MQPFRIFAANSGDASLLAELGNETFLQSHGHSAPVADIAAYVAEKYHPDTVKKELEDPDHIYRIIYTGDQPAGFSKIIFNTPCPPVSISPVAKLERIYLLDKFHGQGLGKALLDYNIEMAKAAGQKGIWLYVWVENQKAFEFYTRMGFRIVGQYDFRISATHTNPNHQMFLSL